MAYVCRPNMIQTVVCLSSQMDVRLDQMQTPSPT